MAAIAQLGERQTEDLEVPSSILGHGILQSWCQLGEASGSQHAPQDAPPPFPLPPRPASGGGEACSDQTCWAHSTNAKHAHAGSRTRVTSMGGLYDTVTLHALCLQWRTTLLELSISGLALPEQLYRF
jgi:hypothetical protein